MELNKKNIHMEDTKCTAAMQITVEEDVIVPDYNPDVSKIIYEKGWIRIDDQKTITDHIQVKGCVIVDILYSADGEHSSVTKMNAAIPFEESIYMQGVESGDRLQLHRELENLTIGMINPRKLSVQSLISFAASVDDVRDVECGIELLIAEEVVCKKQSISATEIVLQKKDVFRLKEECELPKNYPNVISILWEQITIGAIDFQACDGKVLVQGEAKVFLLYEGDGEVVAIRFHEVDVPFSGTIECDGCREDIILDVDYQMEHAEVELRPDFDGEERVIGIDVALDLMVKLYKESEVDLLEDAYGIDKEVLLRKEEVVIKKLLMNTTEKCKVVERIKMKASAPAMMQVCHSDGEVQLADVVITEEGIELSGKVKVKVLYVTNEDGKPYHSLLEMVPFSHVIRAKEMQATSNMKVKGNVEQVQVSVVDGEEMEVKIILCFQAIVWKNHELAVVSDAEAERLDCDTLQDLPSMVLYLAQEGDTLWDVGKRYYTSTEQLREMNGITGELKGGEKLLVVKSMVNKV